MSMVVFDFGDRRSVELDSEPRELPREGVLRDRRVGQVAPFGYTSPDNVLASRSFGHKTSVASVRTRECSRIEHYRTYTHGSQIERVYWEGPAPPRFGARVRIVFSGGTRCSHRIRPLRHVRTIGREARGRAHEHQQF